MSGEGYNVRLSPFGFFRDGVAGLEPAGVVSTEIEGVLTKEVFLLSINIALAYPPRTGFELLFF